MLMITLMQSNLMRTLGKLDDSMGMKMMHLPDLNLSSVLCNCDILHPSVCDTTVIYRNMCLPGTVKISLRVLEVSC